MALFPEAAIVGLGANLGQPLMTVCAAVARMQALARSALEISSPWQSTPVDCPDGSPLFINAVVAFIPRSDETPHSLLERLQSLQRDFGRKPSDVVNAPRLLDLDLIVFGQEIMQEPDLILPHPRATQRRFVLQPLSEIDPGYIFPGERRTVREVLGELRTDEVLGRVEWPRAMGGFAAD